MVIFVCDFLCVLHSNFCMGKTTFLYVILRVIHSNFCMEKYIVICMAILCALHSKFLYGKTLTFLYGIFCMVFLYGKNLTFLCGNFLYGVFLVFDPSFSLFIHPLVLPFC